MLSDLGKNQLGLDISRERDRFGSYFVGLKIREQSDTSPPLITGNTSVEINISPQPENTNVISKLWTMVMDKVTDMMDYVMDESLDGDECYDCDGKNEKSRELKNNVECVSECNIHNQRKQNRRKKTKVESFLICHHRESNQKAKVIQNMR